MSPKIHARKRGRLLSFFSAILFAIPVAVSLSSMAAGQTNINGKTIRSIVTLCSHRECIQTVIRAVFIRDKVLLYSSENQSEGTVFRIGHTLDLSKDEMQSGALTTRRIPGVHHLGHVTARAWSNGVQLELVRDTVHVDSGTVVTRMTQLIEFGVLGNGQCDMPVFNVDIMTPDPRYNQNYRLNSRQCAIFDTQY